MAELGQEALVPEPAQAVVSAKVLGLEQALELGRASVLAMASALAALGPGHVRHHQYPPGEAPAWE